MPCLTEIKFDVLLANLQTKESKRHYYPVIDSPKTISTSTIARQITERCTTNASDIKAVLEAFAQVASEQLALGNTVELPEFGSLALRLKSKEPITDPDIRRLGDKIVIGGVLFRPSKSFIERIGKPFFRRTQTPHTPYRKKSLEEVGELLREFFNASDERHLTRAQFDKLTGFSSTMSRQYLRQLTEQGYLHKIGMKNAPLYTPGEALKKE